MAKNNKSDTLLTLLYLKNLKTDEHNILNNQKAYIKLYLFYCILNDLSNLI